MVSYSAASSPDPYKVGENYRSDGWMGNIGYTDTSAATRRTLNLNTAQKNLVLIVAGDSTAAASGASSYSVTNASVIHNLSIYDGAVYSTVDPLLGATYAPTNGVGTFCSRVVDQLVSAGVFSQVVLVPIGVGGSTSTMWANGLINRVASAMRRLESLGITPATPNITFALDYQSGPNDQQQGISQATYTANVQQIFAAAAAAGFVGRYFVPTSTMLNNVVSASLQAAQAALRNGTTIFDGGNLDSLTGANKQGDGTHYSSSGLSAGATLKYNAYRASGSPF